MALTISNIIFIVFVALVGIVMAISLYINTDARKAIVAAIVTVVVCAALVFGLNWYHTSTAAGARVYKDFQSDISNGVERTMKVIADDGYVIYERSGKFDIEVHDDYVVFDENNQRTILYRSYTSSLVIEETEH